MEAKVAHSPVCIECLLDDARSLSSTLKAYALGSQDIGQVLSAVRDCDPTALKIAALIVLQQLDSEPDAVTHRKFLNTVLVGTLPKPEIGWHQFRV